MNSKDEFLFETIVGGTDRPLGGPLCIYRRRSKYLMLSLARRYSFILKTHLSHPLQLMQRAPLHNFSLTVRFGSPIGPGTFCGAKTVEWPKFITPKLP